MESRPCGRKTPEENRAWKSTDEGAGRGMEPAHPRGFFRGEKNVFHFLSSTFIVFRLFVFVHCFFSTFTVFRLFVFICLFLRTGAGNNWADVPDCFYSPKLRNKRRALTEQPAFKWFCFEPAWVVSGKGHAVSQENPLPEVTSKPSRKPVVVHRFARSSKSAQPPLDRSRPISKVPLFLPRKQRPRRCGEMAGRHRGRLDGTGRG